MHILITAGGTSEKIDEVRSITNHSSGKLGAALAKAALAQQTIIVDYIIAKGAVEPPGDPRIRLHRIENTAELHETMAALLEKQAYDAVIHSMAVSDFTPQVSSDQAAWLKAFNGWLKTRETDELLSDEVFNELLLQIAKDAPAQTKLSSQTEHLLLVLKQTPKVIAMIKEKQPETILVGFKLLVAVSETELLKVAADNLAKNQADYVLANDLTTITDGQHHGYLLSKNGITGEADTKAAIAELILTTIAADVRKKH